MLTFFTRLFAIIGFLVVALICVSIGTGLYMQRQQQTEPESVILMLDFDKPIVEQSQSSPFDFAMDEEPVPLFDILSAIDTARDDPHVKGIVANFGTTQPALAQAQEIRAAMTRFRASGKFTYAFGTSYGSFGLGNRTYYLASSFENIWLQPVGSVALTGLAIQAPFGHAALEKLGVTPDFMQREEYKSVMENVMRDNFSAPVHAEMQTMLANMSDQISDGIAESRTIRGDDVKKLMEQGPFTDKDALKAGLVTHIGYADEFDDTIDQKAGKDVKRVDVLDYMNYGGNNGGASKKIFGHKKKADTANTVAVIFGTGLIMDKASGPAGLTGDHVMGADEIAKAFNDAAKDDSVKAILFRIDSPGGSPEASETIRRALIHAQKKGKPVIVTMGDVAASGGYWVAMNADEIIANPGTLTGSIGVVAGKFSFAELAKKLGISVDTIKTTDDAGMWSMVEGFSPGQRAHVNALLDETYQAFITDVSEARKIPLEKMPEIAKGRVWTGDQAVKIGLVDKLGGYDVALGSLRKKLNLGPDDVVSLKPFPAPTTPTEKILKLLKGASAEQAMIGSALGHWQQVEAMMGPLWDSSLTQGTVAARAPAAIKMVR